MRALVFAAFAVIGGFAYACESFEESNGEPVDAGVEGAADVATSSDAAGDQGAACEGEPDWATTGSAQTKGTCNEATVDLLNDGAHCGRCNHSCGGDMCTNGTCAERKHDSDTAILYGVRNEALYYARRPGGFFGTAGHEVKRFAPATGAVVLGAIDVDASGDKNILGASPTTDFVYVRTKTALLRTSATVASNAMPVLVTTLPSADVSAIAADTDRIYVTIPSGNRIDQLSVDDGGVTPFIADAPRPGETRLVGNKLFWLSQSWVFFAGSASSLRVREGASDKTLYESQDKVGGIAVEGNDAYVMRAGSAGAVMRVDLTTGATEPFYAGDLDNTMFSISVAVDATHVYWLKGTAQQPASTEIWKKARCGGAAVRIGKHAFAYRVMAFEDRLYIGAEDGLFSIAK